MKQKAHEQTKPQILENKRSLKRSILIVDSFESGLKELFFVRNPRLKKEMPEAKKPLADFLRKSLVKPVWVYYSWKKLAIKTLPEKEYFELRTARNRNIITAQEQKKYRQIKVGIAGLSVGSAIVHALAISGGPRVMKIADFDTLEISNLNRIDANLTHFGQNKTYIAACNAWELDPYADLYLWKNGLNSKNLEKFILGRPRLDIFIDEMDSLDLKIRTRLICRKNKIPVLMATDNGDGMILDIERFDQEPKRRIFHGLIGEPDTAKLSNINFREWLRMATKIVGPEYLTGSMQESLLEIGSSIAAVPQLGTSAAIAGSAMSYVVRKIANGQKMPSGRYIISSEEKLMPEFNSRSSKKRRKAETEQFKKRFKA